MRYRVVGIVAGATTSADATAAPDPSWMVWYELWGLPVVVTPALHRYISQDNIGDGTVIEIEYARLAQRPDRWPGRVIARPDFPDRDTAFVLGYGTPHSGGIRRTIAVMRGGVTDAKRVWPHPDVTQRFWDHTSAKVGAATRERLAELSDNIAFLSGPGAVGDIITTPDGPRAVIAVIEQTTGVGSDRQVTASTIAVAPLTHPALAHHHAPTHTPTIDVDVDEDELTGFAITQPPREWVRGWLTDQGQDPDDYDPDRLNAVVDAAFSYHDQPHPAGHYWRLDIDHDDLTAQITSSART